MILNLIIDSVLGLLRDQSTKTSSFLTNSSVNTTLISSSLFLTSASGSPFNSPRPIHSIPFPTPNYHSSQFHFDRPFSSFHKAKHFFFVFVLFFFFRWILSQKALKPWLYQRDSVATLGSGKSSSWKNSLVWQHLSVHLKLNVFAFALLKRHCTSCKARCQRCTVNQKKRTSGTIRLHSVSKA